MLVRFWRICGGFAVAVLQLGKLLCCSLGFWTLLLEPFADSPRAVLRVSSEAFGEVPQLQFIDEWLLQLLLRSGSQCKLWRRPEIPWCSSGWLSICTLLCNDRFMVQTVQNCGVPQLRCPVKVVDVFAVAVHRQGVAVPVILQGPEIPWCSLDGRRHARWCANDRIWSDSAQRRVRNFSSSVMEAMMGFFDAFCVIFRAPPVVPELSASFSSFRALTLMSARGLQGWRVAGSLLSGDSALGCQPILK